jgi:RNA polymerase sigma factor (sigma-70 family)
MSSAAEFIEWVSGRLVASLVLYTGDQSLAEDLAQEALVRVWRNWDEVSQMASPEGWTFRTARNLALSFRRRRKIEERIARLLYEQESESQDPDVASALSVRRAVAALPERQRATVVARFYLDLSVKETAALLECKEGSVKAATSQAISSLRSQGLLADTDDKKGNPDV